MVLVFLIMQVVVRYTDRDLTNGFADQPLALFFARIYSSSGEFCTYPAYIFTILLVHIFETTFFDKSSH